MTSRVLRPCAALLKSGKRLQNSESHLRNFCVKNDANSAINLPLSKPLPGHSMPRHTSVKQIDNGTSVTELENGLKVATENKLGHFSTIGVILDSGSRYEVNFPSGISHFLEKLAFQGTTKYKNRDDIQHKLEQFGGICDCQGSRDVLIYAASVESRGAEQVVDILSEAILRPEISQSEIEGASMAVKSELEMLEMNPDSQQILTELIHMAAYRDNTLGLPKFCPAENIDIINKSSLYKYMNVCHKPNRMVLTGVGIEHNTLVDLAKEYFVNKTPIWHEDSDIRSSNKLLDTSTSQYTGGCLVEEKDLSNVSLGPTPMPELSHFVLGFESCSHQDDDFIAFCVLNMLMGGGGSFSAGGPGKGMYTRLYRNVLNSYHWMNSATAFNHAYQDSGMFCILASAPPAQFRSMVEVIIKEFLHTSNNVPAIELHRAKTQLQSMLLMNLESRPIIFEDVGRQVLASGIRRPADDLYQAIGAIQSSDIKRVANRMLSSKPTVVGYGDTSRLPSYDDINTALLNQGHFPRKFSLFS